MKLLILVLLLIKLSTSEFLNSPLLTVFPCSENKDVIIWYDPSLPARERNRYYVYIEREIPKDKVIMILFDEPARITHNFQMDRGNFLRFTYGTESNKLIMRLFQSFQGFGFIVKGTVPGQAPYITSIRIGDEEICERPNQYYFQKYLLESWNSGPQENCGRRKVVHKINTNKRRSTRIRKSRLGDWPWHAAIYRSEELVNKYKCGGTLVSKTYVLTAAHCVSIRGVALLPEMLMVVLGRFDLRKKRAKSIEKLVQRVIPYQGFVQEHLYSDIALLKLNGAVTFNALIQPACLWYNKADERLPAEDILGTMVGWGYNQTTGLSFRQRHIEMPMVSDTTCILSDMEFFGEKLIDETTFCAGYRNITNACNGDSGSAFQVYLPDDAQNPNTTGAYYVRGIVSQSVVRMDEPGCLPNQYIIFTDIKLYRTWIDAYVEEDDY